MVLPDDSGPKISIDPAARHAADAERVVDADGARRNEIDRLDGPFLAEPHDRALAELLFDLADGQLHRLQAFAVVAVVLVDKFLHRSVNGRHTRSLHADVRVFALWLLIGVLMRFLIPADSVQSVESDADGSEPAYSRFVPSESQAQ